MGRVSCPLKVSFICTGTGALHVAALLFFHKPTVKEFTGKQYDPFPCQWTGLSNSYSLLSQVKSLNYLAENHPVNAEQPLPGGICSGTHAAESGV